MKKQGKEKTHPNKFEQLIEQLSPEELIKLEEDIKYGGWMMRNIITEQKKRIEHQNKICVMCGQELVEITDFLTLQFGSLDFRRQAHFCAADCLMYFLEKVRNLDAMKKKTKEDQKPQKV